VAAAVAKAASPRSLRLNKVLLTDMTGAGAHVPQPDVLQLPQLLSTLLMTFNPFSIFPSPFEPNLFYLHCCHFKNEWVRPLVKSPGLSKTLTVVAKDYMIFRTIDLLLLTRLGSHAESA
jgi:hypothetical protein